MAVRRQAEAKFAHDLTKLIINFNDLCDSMQRYP